MTDEGGVDETDLAEEIRGGTADSAGEKSGEGRGLSESEWRHC
mgnify:FL=1